MSPRDLSVVIGDLLGVIPETESNLRAELEKIRYRLAFRAPELGRMGWEEAEMALRTLGDPSKGPPWVQNVARIFTAK